MSFHVRPAAMGDIGKIWGLILELADYEKLLDRVTGSPEALANHLFGDRPCVEGLVGELDGEIISYALFFPTYSTFLTLPGLWLEDIYVQPAYRGRGYGKVLLQQVIDIAKARRCQRLEWAVLTWNTPSIEFYRGIGARIMDDWHTCRLELGP